VGSVARWCTVEATGYHHILCNVLVNFFRVGTAGSGAVISGIFLLKKLEIEYVREYSPKIWPEIWYSTSILGSWNSHWIILDLRNRPTVAWRKKMTTEISASRRVLVGAPRHRACPLAGEAPKARRGATDARVPPLCLHYADLCRSVALVLEEFQDVLRERGIA
jgi:hypothetical protein